MPSPETTRATRLGPTAGPLLFVLTLTLLFSPSACAPAAPATDGMSDGDGTRDVPKFTGVVSNRISNLIGSFQNEVNHNLGYCIKDLKKDWQEAFNFLPDTRFLSNCLKQTKGGLTRRLCTSAEISFYFNSFRENDGQTSAYLKPNRNCNLSSWVSGCEPGWSCSIGKNQKIDLLDKKLLPARTLECRPCCEGFFCPRGITCMMLSWNSLDHYVADHVNMQRGEAVDCHVIGHVTGHGQVGK